MPQSPGSNQYDSMEEEPDNQKVKVHDWVIVKLCGKKRRRYFVSLITNSNRDVLTMKFARRSEGRDSNGLILLMLLR